MKPLLKVPRWQRRAFWFCLSLLLASGCAWLLLHYGRGDDELPSAGEAWLLRIHGLTAAVALLVIGALAGSHVPAGWHLSRRYQRPQQRQTGLLLSGLLLAAIFSAYALAYLVPEAWHAMLGWAHAGLAGLSLLAWRLHRPRRA